jgi:tRNA dimethylallyltransferase
MGCVAKTECVMIKENNNPNPIIIVAGPTASGKSALAMNIAQRFGGEIVNADSMQIYRELRVLTARPDANDEDRVPHHLYGTLSIAEICSAGFWLEAALGVITAIRARGKLPVVCGGTGLYIKVLMEGIAAVPEIPSYIVDEARRLYVEEGGAAFKARLAALDPNAADRLDEGDGQRLLRAYGVIKATGRTLADWQNDQPITPPLDARFLKIILAPPRPALYARIESRFEDMLEAGALDEVAALMGLNLQPSLPAMKALGVPDFMRNLRGEVTLEDAVDKAKQATRNFAKRQSTWFRHQITADLAIEDFGAAAWDTAEPIVRDFIDAGNM